MTTAQRPWCTLSLLLFRYSVVVSKYDAESGLSRKFTLSGIVDDPDKARPSHQTAVDLEIVSPIDPKWLKRLAEAVGDDLIVGGIYMRAGLQPEKYEDGGDSVDIAPIRTRVAVDNDSFERIRRQATEACDQRVILSAQLTLVGGGLPVPETKVDAAFGRPFNELEVSNDCEFGIASIELSNTIYVDEYRDRVLAIDPKPTEGYGTTISVLITQIHYSVNIERGCVSVLRCEGTVLSARGAAYKEAEVSIEFTRHGRNRLSEDLPKQAYFGEFDYRPRDSREDSLPDLQFELRYPPQDEWTRMLPLLGEAGSARIVVHINLIVEQTDLQNARSKVHGDVRSYSFQVDRMLKD